MDGIPCKCGCGQLVTSKRRDGTFREWKPGHSSRGKTNEWSRRPDSQNPRTGRWRARLSIPTDTCALAWTRQCCGRIEVHHIDKNPVNNDPSNIIAVCKSHHKFMETGQITMDAPMLPEFRVGSDGKRRYKRP